MDRGYSQIMVHSNEQCQAIRSGEILGEMKLGRRCRTQEKRQEGGEIKCSERASETGKKCCKNSTDPCAHLCISVEGSHEL